MHRIKEKEDSNEGFCFTFVMTSTRESEEEEGGDVMLRY
jgi:outer membrane lipoprotein-sorting protein